MLSKQVDLANQNSLLDVAGGSGAFTIMLCKKNPRLSSTIFDFPVVGPVALKFVFDAGLESRVKFVAGNALKDDWPPGHDTVLMSYLFSSVGGDDIDTLLGHADRALPPGGMLIVHDFFIENDKTGPRDAALWFLTCMFNSPDAVVLTPSLISKKIRNAGFDDAEFFDLVPGLTKVAIARKKPA